MVMSILRLGRFHCKVILMCVSAAPMKTIPEVNVYQLTARATYSVSNILRRESTQDGANMDACTYYTMDCVMNKVLCHVQQ